MWEHLQNYDSSKYNLDFPSPDTSLFDILGVLFYNSFLVGLGLRFLLPFWLPWMLKFRDFCPFWPSGTIGATLLALWVPLELPFGNPCVPLETRGDVYSRALGVYWRPCGILWTSWLLFGVSWMS